MTNLLDYRNNSELKGKPLRLEFGNGGRKKRNDGCFTCGSLTHIAKDCTKSMRDNPSNYYIFLCTYELV